MLTPPYQPHPSPSRRIAPFYNELVWRPTVKKIRSDRGGIGGQLEKPLRDSDRSAERIILGIKIHFDVAVQKPEFHTSEFVRYWSNSGHRRGLPISLFEPLRCHVLSLGEAMRRRGTIGGEATTARRRKTPGPKRHDASTATGPSAPNSEERYRLVIANQGLKIYRLMFCSVDRRQHLPKAIG